MIRHYFLILLLFSGCVSSIEPDISTLGVNYTPLKIGDFHIFSVSEKTYNSNGTEDSLGYFLKETVFDSLYIEAQDITEFFINRFRKEAIEDDWVYFETVSQRIDLRSLVSVEDNVPVVSVVYPMSEGLTWDANAKNSLPTDSYELENLGHPFKVDSITFVNTVQVTQEDLRDPIMISNDDYRIEVYADLVGLIYKQQVSIQWCGPSTGPSCSETRPLSGYELEQKLIEFGKE